MYFQRDLKDIGERRLQDGTGKAKAEFVSGLQYYIPQPHLILYYAKHQLSSDMSTYPVLSISAISASMDLWPLIYLIVIHLKITVSVTKNNHVRSIKFDTLESIQTHNRTHSNYLCSDIV